MRPGAAFALLFGLLAVVMLVAAIWTAPGLDLSGKLFATFIVVGCAGVGSFLADRGRGDA